MQEVADLAVRMKGEVFGGFVRDFLLHEEAAKKYFKEGHSQSDYGNEEVAPELIDRLLVPSDIDVRFDTIDDYYAFKRGLVKMSYKISTIRESGYAVVHLAVVLEMRVCPGVIGTESSRLVKNNFSSINKIIPGSYFTIDVVLKKPDTFLDFECNGLVMNAHGIQLCEELEQGQSVIGRHRKLQSVTEDILSKKAVCLNFYENRWKKMDKKGWVIQGLGFHKVKPSKDDMCIICHLENPDYKLYCCNAKYHLECLKKTMVNFSSSNCVHCREDLSDWSRVILAL